MYGLGLVTRLVPFYMYEIVQVSESSFRFHQFIFIFTGLLTMFTFEDNPPYVSLRERLAIVFLPSNSQIKFFTRINISFHVLVRVILELSAY